MIWLSLTNDVPKLDIKYTFEERSRFERRINRDFNDALGDGRSELLTRVRPGFTFTYGDRISGAFQYQYAHSFLWRDRINKTDENSDASLAFVRYKNSGWTTTIGRQKINLGSERLIGCLEWANVARAMDGVRFQSKDWDFAAFKFGVSWPRIYDARVGFVSHPWRQGTTSAIFKHDETPSGDVDITTLTHAYTGKIAGMNFDFEGALQVGDNAGKDQEAWAWHVGLSKSLDSRTKLYVEANAASGGSDADTSRTFDNLYPTNHKFYGSMDMQSWKNMNEFAVQIDHKLNTKTDLRARWSSLSLRDPSDAWYGAGGAPNKRPGGSFVDPTGTSGRDIGNEFNLEATYRLNKVYTITGGIGIFSPGKYVKNVNGGNADQQAWGYVSMQVRF
ncbi:MAG: alginate export family protein [Fimbriimonadaceae bacterium]|nr:alginate export family protein [Fimbriimonadaceae bacterium]